MSARADLGPAVTLLEDGLRRGLRNRWRYDGAGPWPFRPLHVEPGALYRQRRRLRSYIAAIRLLRAAQRDGAAGEG